MIENGMTMMLKSLGLDKLIAQYIPTFEALINEAKQRIDEYQRHIDERFDRIEELLAQYAAGESPAGIGATQQAIEKSPDVNGVILDKLYEQFVTSHKNDEIVTVKV